MKKLLLSLLFFTGIANAQTVNIPDAAFKAKLIAIGVDTSGDGEIQTSEALAQTSLYISYSNIHDLTGIEAFTNLQNLDCSDNQIVSLDVSNLNNLQNLDCSHNQITSLNVLGLSNLHNLYCAFNQLSNINVSGLYNLENIYCSYNQLTSLNIINLTNLRVIGCEYNYLQNINLIGMSNLTELICVNNQLTSLNVSGLNMLEILQCDNNQLTSLNVSGLTHLWNLGCNSNQLTILDATNLTSLRNLYCNNNHLTSLGTPSNLEHLECRSNNINVLGFCSGSLQYVDCSGNHIVNLELFCYCYSLQNLYCNSNQLTSLDVSMCPNLQYLDCSSNYQLENINIKNGTNETINIAGSPNIHYICADASQVSQIENQIASIGLSSTCSVNTYCNFVPGGSFNMVTGNVRYDMDNNGCSSTDVALQNSVQINITDGTVASSTFSTTDGSYLLYTLTGTNTLSTSLENPSYFNITPTATTITTTTLGNTQTQDFCITANGVHNDVEVVIVPITTARPGFDATYKIVYRNKGNQTESGNIVFTYDDAVLEYVSSSVTPSATAVGSLTWDYNNLLPFESRSFTVTLNANTPTETPPVNIGDILNFTATINPISGDELPNDNTFAFSQTVVGSYDPNDKTCLEGEVVTPTKIGDYLHYNINFENTGTAPAENVVVKDVIDTTKFDINTLQILDSSNPVMTKITGNVVEFIFQNINLGASVHGNVVFKIKTKTSLTTGSNVTNTANIYFDYNVPVTTNTATTTFQSLSNNGYAIDNSVRVYPNPAKNNININCNSTIKSIQLFDVQGRILTTKLANETQSNLDISSYTDGVYFIKIISDRGQKIEKVIKE